MSHGESFMNIFKSAASKITGHVKTWYEYAHKQIAILIAGYKSRYHALDQTGKNRVIVLTLALIIVADYLMISYHTGRNPLNIFPSLPVLDMRDKITVFIPSTDGQLLKENRIVQKSDDHETYIKRLVQFVITGSMYENTRVMTPIRGFVRKVWVHDKICVIDFWPETLEDDIQTIPGSEAAFREAVKKTVMENIPQINDVIILENGIPNKSIWETSAQSGQTPVKISDAGPVINK